MTSLNDLKSLLYLDIKRNNEIINEIKKIETVIIMYNDLNNLFDCKNVLNISNNLLTINIILDIIYGKKVRESFDIENLVYSYLNNNDELSLKKLKRLSNKFKIDFSLEFNKIEKLKLERMDIETEKITKRIISNIKYEHMLTKEEILFINDRLTKENISTNDIIEIIEKVKIHYKKLDTYTSKRLNYG